MPSRLGSPARRFAARPEPRFSSVASWWEQLSPSAYPHAQSLTITADSGGSNSPRGRLWKRELARLAEQIGIPIRVLHYPPGTSKWNRIEHRLFSYISINWRSKPLTSYEAIVNLIAATTTTTGLKVYAHLDENEYPTEIKITDTELAAVTIERHLFHGDWNYTVHRSNTTRATIKS